MFTLSQIKNTHSKVNSGADFPQYINDLLALGVLKYSIHVSDRHAEYFGEDDYTICSPSEYSTLDIAPETDLNLFKEYLRAHQQGKTDYFSFCKHSAETGVDKWIVDILARTCIYYDKLGNSILEEKIPI